ncbi:MAG: HAMP domain-containing protein [Deinococcus-Thermus bacterium]|jgi:signal transduction histidine kinase|nr:HAMP domain-containing protein [Deinococcota bacterium]
MRVSLAAVVVLELLGLVLLAQGVLYTSRRTHPSVAAELAPIATRLLEADGDPRALAAFIERPISVRDQGPPLSVTVPRPPQGYTVVLDAGGALWFDVRAPSGSPDTEAASSRVGRSARALAERAMDQAALKWRQGLTRTMTATPLRTDDGRTVGALLQVSTLQPATPGLLILGFGALAVATLFVVLIGTVFGLYASRPLTRRIERLAAAADAWSDGDFSAAVHDASDDELGRLARRLDRMAGELQELVAVRQAVAGGEERARIARELHDSVKQQVFAASMRLGAARSAAPGDADGHLGAAEKLVRQAQQELSDLIHELRPVATHGRPLDVAIRELAEGYVGDGGPEPDLPGMPEVGAALYRIAQEALANAVRHAQAQRVAVRVRSEGGEVVLRVEDDGRGFLPRASDGRGVGLDSMRERAEALGGRLRVDTSPGRGTRIEARLPTRGAGPGGAERGST